VAPDEPLRLPPQLLDGGLYGLSLLGSAARRAAIAAFAELGLRLDHVAFLASLDDFGPSSQRVLGRRLRKDPSDVVGALDDLQAEGLVRRAPDPADARRKLVSITAKGRRTLGRAQVGLAAAEDEFFGGLDAADRRALQRLVRAGLAGVDDRA
jgi:DNA-binding MarR family transcriptional regulator